MRRSQQSGGVSKGYLDPPTVLRMIMWLQEFQMGLVKRTAQLCAPNQPVAAHQLFQGIASRVSTHSFTGRKSGKRGLGVWLCYIVGRKK